MVPEVVRLIWTREDEMALASCMKVKRSADRYKTRPVPVYRTLLKMYEVMTAAGLIQRELVEPSDVCAGCVNHRDGTCRKGYQQIEMSFRDEKIVRCGLRRERKDPFPEPPKVRAREDRDSLCHGCAEAVNGTSCRNGYSGARLDSTRTKVVECRSRREGKT